MSVLNFGNKWLTPSLTNKAEACWRGGREGGWLPEAHVQSPSHSHLVTLDKQVRESGVQTVLPGFRCLDLFVRERRAGAWERSPVCWRGCKSCFVSQGSFRKPGDPADLLDAGQGLRMTHPFLEEKQVSEKPSQGEQGGKGRRMVVPQDLTVEDPYWAVQRLRTWPQARSWGWEAVNKGRVRNNKAGESENQEDLERLWYWFHPPSPPGVQEEWNSRKSWWPSFHFSYFWAKSNWKDDKTLACEKALVAGLLLGKGTCFVFFLSSHSF